MNNNIMLTKNRLSYLLPATRYLLPVIFIWLLLSPVQAAAAHLTSIDLIERAYRNGAIRYSDALNYKVSAIFSPDSLPAIYRSNGIIKSATPLLMEARLNKHLLSPENERILAKGRGTTLTKLYGTGVTLRSYASPEGHFRIHFTTDNTNGDAVPIYDGNGDGTPDYVEQFAVILDNVWATEVGVLGYDAPPSDETEGGDCLLDVYLADLTAYGFTQIDEFDPVSMVYMIFENDFAGFPPNTDPDGDAAGAMKVVAAHEFFHTMQFQITEDIITNGWWMEASATWMEDRVYPEVNDYINYIDYWFHCPQLPLDTYDVKCKTSDPFSLFPYGTSVWIKHMTEKYGSKFVFDVWKKIKDGSPNVSALSAVTAALADRGITLDEELKELRVANVTMTYEDAPWYALWQTINPSPDLLPIAVEYSADNPDFSSSVTYTDVSLLLLSARYYSFSAPQGSGYLTIAYNGGGNTSVMLIGFHTDGGYDISEVLTDPANNDGSIIINGFAAAGPYSRVIVIPLNYSDSTAGSFTMTVSYSAGSTGSVSSLWKIKPDTTSLITGDSGINGKQQYSLIMRDGSGNQVLQSGAAWADNSPYIDIDGNGLAVVTNAVTGETITASLQSFLLNAILTAAAPATMSAGKPRACTAKKSDSRCFIATAAFGSQLHPYVGLLREFRDSYMLTNPLGRWFVSVYYDNSPPVAGIIAHNGWLKAIVKIFLIPAIIVSWAMLKLTLSEKIFIAVLMAVLGFRARTLFKTNVP